MKVIQSPMKFQVVLMGPHDAQMILDKNHPRNRKPKKNKIEYMNLDMIGNLWRLTHQAIAIDEDDKLIDGQNRLAAIIRSGLEIPVVLCTGVPRNAMLGADCGTPRNVTDAAKISGSPLPHGANGFASVARRMAIGIGATGDRLTIQSTLRFIKDHKEALEFAYDCLPKNIRLLTQASIRAVVARAWYKRNSRSRIREFCEVYLSGIPNKISTDQAALRFRAWVTDKLATSSRGGKLRPNFKIVYCKCEAALHAFLNEEPVTKLHESSKELFPIPGDSDHEPEAEPVQETHKTNGKLVAV